MEKRNYLKPEINSYKFESAHFIALSGNQNGEGGTSCNEFVTDTILEYLFMISTESSARGAVDTAKLKCYLKDNNLTIGVRTGFEGNISGTGITLNNNIANIAGLSFDDKSYYNISVNSAGCFVFTPANSGDAPYYKDLTGYSCKN